jgi:hypothetical protein
MLILILLIILILSIIIYFYSNKYINNKNIYKKYIEIDKYIPVIDLPDYNNNSYYFEKDSLSNNRFNREIYEPNKKKINIEYNRSNNFRKTFNKNLSFNSLTNNRKF